MPKQIDFDGNQTDIQVPKPVEIESARKPRKRRVLRFSQAASSPFTKAEAARIKEALKSDPDALRLYWVREMGLDESRYPRATPLLQEAA